MASNTENLNLLMKNPSTDGADTFNIQTMLNENWQKIDNNAGTVAQTLANILKPTTPPIIGLPPSTTPDGMFQALGNTGELHVWKKTITSGTGTTTTYPVSTNSNAYQEGSDAKPAGYTLGEATNGVVISDMSGTADFEITTGTAVNVSDDGAVALGGSVTTLSSTYKLSKIVSDLKTYGSGKFCSIVCTYNKQYTSGKFLTGIWYIPSDATMSVDTTITGAAVNLSVVGAKPVTGYAAIPAGTTIEYLGKLGDKARVQVVSYVGTGTYGRDNKNHLTFSGKPRFVMVPGAPFGYAYIPNGNFYYAITGNYVALEDLNCVWDDDTNTMTWYHSSYPYRQYNASGTKYTFVAIY